MSAAPYTNHLICWRCSPLVRRAAHDHRDHRAQRQQREEAHGTVAGSAQQVRGSGDAEGTDDAAIVLERPGHQRGGEHRDRDGRQVEPQVWAPATRRQLPIGEDQQQ